MGAINLVFYQAIDNGNRSAPLMRYGSTTTALFYQKNNMNSLYKIQNFEDFIQFYLSMSHSTLPLACHAQSIPFCKTGILLCWHFVSWLGKQSSLRCSEVSLSLVFQTTAGADGRPNVTETTSEAGYSSVPVALLQHPPSPHYCSEAGIRRSSRCVRRRLGV